MRFKMRNVLIVFVLFVLTACVQVQTGNDVIDATTAVATGIYMQKQIDKQKEKSGKTDPFKKKDPKVAAIDEAINKARAKQQGDVQTEQKFQLK
ncbi:hypothetical protein [Rheinheimera sp. 4Y26]|uniref:hypothetical protein n=1 Tax=Rheinheimera sp. 4Y26 TaxID=2977811 RepID=UPI0021B14C1B|nr:hypothetical protein [Rheinheimera sp. 4Y26]MCT6700742.1 hypothetical protein [Rheinheimera sp. 4Y26]